MELLEGKMTGTMSSDSISTRLQKIARLARNMPEAVLTTLAHHIDVDFLREAYRRTRKDGAVGVDGQTAEEYSQDLEANLEDLLNRFKTGRYKAPPVRRTYIPKGDGKSLRPLGIPTFEDKVLQRAVAMVLEAVYEQDFLDCSYGFRPGRSAHQALASIQGGLMRMRGGWVLDVDIRGFFDALEHSHLRDFLDHRVRDGVVRRAIGKWLKAGVLESGSVRRSDSGTPQGGVISPILSNIYLHYVLDQWFATVVKPRMRGACFLVRYADDFVIACAREDDAQRVMAVLPKRFGKYGLELHPTKTRMVAFRRPPRRGVQRRDDQRPGPGTFDFLGFTHYWAVSRKGNWVVKQKTARSRFNRSVKRIADWCRRHRHLPVADQHRMLSRKLRGHNAYYGITGNSGALARFRTAVQDLWRAWLNRRSQRKHMPWARFARLLQRYPLPPPTAIHSTYRYAANP